MHSIEAKQTQLKSILKNSVLERGESAESDAREIAIRQTRLFQLRKEMESEILESLVVLSWYPLVRDPIYSASNPAPSDVSGFKTHLRYFRPSDYDDLIEERTVNDLCGYVLCPKPGRKVAGIGKWKITPSGDIVKREDYERWCSPACAKRALFVKVQLDERAAWDRGRNSDGQIDLLEEDRSKDSEADRAARAMRDLRADEQRQAAKDYAALARERGSHGVGDSNAAKVKVVLREKEINAPVPEDTSGQSDHDHLLIEGRKFDLPLRPRGGS
ncbi:hypothetical protein E4U57_005484 [Claviceps arundinis]|uniref:RNA polymerase II subunit B1 CTD phosphatase RPAP2 homolog n=1 Tax=Claviceps arundinis TaxID=1623583 RepID=A0ABQ7PHU3_9HYPO|nr:hypothetical protein E4U57_005484 [Claviceps arundinis]